MVELSRRERAAFDIVRDPDDGMRDCAEQWRGRMTDAEAYDLLDLLKKKGYVLEEWKPRER